jgi:exosortase
MTAKTSDWRIPAFAQPIGTRWPMVLGLLAMSVATIARLGSQTWSTELGSHGPFVLATGLWLLSRAGLKVRRDADHGEILWLMASAATWAVYIFGRAYDFLSLEAAALYLSFLIASFMLFGAAEVRRNWFPFLYMAFLIPPPGWVMDQLTAPLQVLVSYGAVSLLQALGYPIARDGIVLNIAQYQLQVEDACAGMNSLTGLIALSLFYVYFIHRASWRYSLLLAALIIPVAIFVNFLRVVALIIVTYYWGDAAAQGFLHLTAGILLFVLALGTMFLLDSLLQRFFSSKSRPHEA